MSPRVRLLRGMLLTATVLVAVYAGVCMQMLSRLGSMPLIAQYAAPPYAANAPVSFPIARWVTDLYWNLTGREQIVAGNRDSNQYVKYLADRIAQARERSEPLDYQRAEKLLAEWVCAKRDDKKAVRDLDIYQQRWRSDPLAAAMRTCQLPISARQH